MLAIFFFFAVVLLVLIHLTAAQSSSPVPKVIWTYWHDEDLPDIVQACIVSWRRHNPEYTINVVSPRTLLRYCKVDVLSLKLVENSTRAADFVRVLLLALYGGIWIDASIICNASLQWLQEAMRGKEFFCFYLPEYTTIPKRPAMETFFMAAKRGSVFAKKYCAEFMRSNDFDSMKAYIQDLREEGIDLQAIEDPEYLAVSAAGIAVMQRCEDHISKIYFLDAKSMSYSYLHEDWDSFKAITRICKDPRFAATPLLKMRVAERRALQEHPEIKRCLIEKMTNPPL